MSLMQIRFRHCQVETAMPFGSRRVHSNRVEYLFATPRSVAYDVERLVPQLCTFRHLDVSNARDTLESVKSCYPHLPCYFHSRLLSRSATVSVFTAVASFRIRSASTVFNRLDPHVSDRLCTRNISCFFEHYVVVSEDFHIATAVKGLISYY